MEVHFQKNDINAGLYIPGMKRVTGLGIYALKLK